MDDAPPLLRRWHIATVLGLLLVHATLAWQARAFGITTGNDDATFILLSRSLRDFGYHDLHLVGSPPHPRTPPGFPAMLAVIGGTFGEHFDLFLAGVLATSLASLALLYDLVRRVSGPAVALAVLAMAAVNPMLVNYAGEIMSESLYILLTVAAVWAVVRERDGPERHPWLWPALAIVCACGAALTRTIGVTIVGALFLHWALERRWRRLGILLGAAAVSVGGWILWTIFAPVKIVGRSYVADAVFVRSEDRSLATLVLERLRNIPGYVTEDLPFMLPLPTLPGTVVDNLLGLAVVLGAMIVGVFALRRSARAAVLYVAAYAAVLAIWPWRLERFLVPLLPFLYWLIVAGAAAALVRWRRLRLLPYAVAAIVVAAAIPRTWSLVSSARRCDRDHAMQSADCYAPAQRAFFALADYAREALPDSAVFVTEKEGTFGYLSHRRAMLHTQFAWGAVDAVALLTGLRASGADYINITPLVAAYVQHVPELLQVCRELTVVRAFPAATYLLHVTSERGGGEGENACAVLHRYEQESAGFDRLLGGP